jgi:hypothetical protein
MDIKESKRQGFIAGLFIRVAMSLFVLMSNQRLIATKKRK